MERPWRNKHLFAKEISKEEEMERKGKGEKKKKKGRGGERWVG